VLEGSGVRYVFNSTSLGKVAGSGAIIGFSGFTKVGEKLGSLEEIDEAIEVDVDDNDESRVVSTSAKTAEAVSLCTTSSFLPAAQSVTEKKRRRGTEYFIVSLLV
jgi:hypothetical protein